LKSFNDNIFFYLRNPPKADKSAKSVDKLLSLVAAEGRLAVIRLLTPWA
jgi:hypothetical protein